MDRYSLLARLAAFLFSILLTVSWIGAIEPGGRAPVVVRTVGNMRDWPKGDSYVSGSTGSRRIDVDAQCGVLANDRPPEPLNKDLKGDGELAAVLVQPPEHATHFTLNSDGSFVYEPQPGFVGLDTFRYRIKGVEGAPASATIHMPQIPVAIRVKTNAGGNPGQPTELTNRNNSGGAGFIVYPVNGPVNFAITVPYRVDAISHRNGAATLDADFTLGFTEEWTPKGITIPADCAGVTIDLTVLPDRLVEGREMVSVYLQQNGPSKFTLQGRAWSASLYIDDNDYWKWDKQSISGSYQPKEFDPKLGDRLAALGGAWYVDSKTGNRVWDDGDSKFQPYAVYRIQDDGLSIRASARWEWYCPKFACVERVVDTPSAHMDLGFDFEPQSGHIHISDKSGSGLAGGQVRVSYRYTINNSGNTVKVATVWYQVVAGVGGMRASRVVPFGTNRGGRKEFSAETSDGGGTALSESRVVTFTLRSTEDP